MIDPAYPLFYTFHFYLFGVIALASALAFVTRKSPVAAALWLVNVMFALAALYVMLDAHFIAAIQVLVYAGAIMVVFLFVIMLLNLGHPSELADVRGKWGKAAATVLGLILLAEIAVVSGARVNPEWILPRGEMDRLLAEKGAVGVVADPLFTHYLLAFELTSVLLLIAIVGAVTLGRRSDHSIEPTAEESAHAG
ncbi:MAG: NADH-quinone oxidoreductase subunit J [Gemmatimonadaceae bacterium]